VISIRPIKYPEDYSTLMDWWAKRGMKPLNKAIFPGTGAVAFTGPLEIAMSFLYLDVGGAFAMIEWTSVNPACAMSRTTVEAVRGLFAHLEEQAKKRGCICITSMVKDGGSEQRIMSSMGYASQNADDPPHIMYAKTL
jgi:hypothetical protein